MKLNFKTDYKSIPMVELKNDIEIYKKFTLITAFKTVVLHIFFVMFMGLVSIGMLVSAESKSHIIGFYIYSFAAVMFFSIMNYIDRSIRLSRSLKELKRRESILKK